MRKWLVVALILGSIGAGVYVFEPIRRAPPGSVDETASRADGRDREVDAEPRSRRHRAGMLPPPVGSGDEPAGTSTDAGGPRLLVLGEEPDGDRPLAGAAVTLERSDGSTVSMRTDDGGVVVLGPDVLSALSLRVWAPGRERHGWFPDDSSLWLPDRVVLRRGFEVAGRVIDAVTGVPIEGAALTARRSFVFGGGGNGGPPPPAFQDRTTSDADGRFRFPGLSPASKQFDFRKDLTIEVGRTGYVPTTRTPLLLPPDDGPEDLVLALDPEGTIEGRVVDAEGRPVPRAEVRGWTDTGRWDRIWSPRMTCDDDGRFVLHEFPVGARVEIMAFAETHESASALSVVAPSVEPVILTVERRRTFPLRVVPPAGVQATERRLRLFTAGYGQGRDLPETDAPIVVGPVSPGRLGVLVMATGAAPALRWFDAPPAANEEVVVQLEPEAVVEGVVVDDRGTPVVGAEVTVGPVTFDAATAHLTREGRSDERGAFRVAGLMEGNQVLDVRAAGHVRVVRPVTPGGASARVELVRLGAVEARLVVPAGHTMPRGCGVDLSEDGPEVSRPPWEGGAGFYRPDGTIEGATLRIAGLPPGRHRISVSTSDFLGAALDVHVMPGSTSDAGVVRLDAGLSLEGRVLDLRGRPLAGVRVSTLERSWDHGVGDTDDEGRFVMRPVSPGRHVLVADRPGMALRHAIVVTADSGPVTLRMQRTRPVRIRVRDADDDAVAGAFVRLELDSVVATHAHPDAGGTARVDLLPGRYEAVVLDADSSELAAAIPLVVGSVPAGADSGLEVVLRVPSVRESAEQK